MALWTSSKTTSRLDMVCVCGKLAIRKDQSAEHFSFAVWVAPRGAGRVKSTTAPSHAEYTSRGSPRSALHSCGAVRTDSRTEPYTATVPVQYSVATHGHGKSTSTVVGGTVQLSLTSHELCPGESVHGAKSKENQGLQSFVRT